MGMHDITFDLDGMLYYTDHYHCLVWKALADKLSLPFDEQANNRPQDVSRMESLEIILNLDSETYSQEEKEQMVAGKDRLYRSYLECMGPEVLTPGTINALCTLRENGWKTGIGSFSKDAPLILERTELDGFFDVVTDGSQIIKSKPDPEVFQLATRKLRLPPGECAAVEDASAGVLATNVGGFFPIDLGDTAQATGYRAILNALYELSELCQRLYNHTPEFKPPDSTPFSQGGGAVKKEEHPSGRRYGSVETCHDVRRVVLSAGKRVLAKALPLRL